MQRLGVKTLTINEYLGVTPSPEGAALGPGDEGDPPFDEEDQEEADEDDDLLGSYEAPKQHDEQETLGS